MSTKIITYVKSNKVVDKFSTYVIIELSFIKRNIVIPN